MAERGEAIQVTPTEAPPPSDPDIHGGLDIPNFDLWMEEVGPCESQNTVDINTGNGYSGIIQFHPRTWRAIGGEQFAPFAYQATLYEQLYMGEVLLRHPDGGAGSWPKCAAGIKFNMRELRDPSVTMAMQQ